MVAASPTTTQPLSDGSAEPHFLFRLAGFSADGKQRRRHTKHVLMAAMVLSNVAIISLSWAIPKIWYIFIPFCACISFMNTCMVLSMTGWLIHNKVLTPASSALARMVRSSEANAKVDADKAVAIERKSDPCTLAYVVPCYNESKAEVMATVESLHSQTKLDQHRKLLIVFCDGHVKGAGESMTTADMLLEDLFAPSKDCTVARQQRFESAYRSWTGVQVSVTCQWGEYKGLPYLVINKDINRGKRDTLIALRSLLYAYNRARPAEETIFSAEFLSTFGQDIAGADVRQFDFIVGTDADTTFSAEATANLIAKVREEPNTVGVSGVIRVAFRHGTAWRFWSLYQNAEYLRAQALRRTHQSEVTHKVTCLPGACQILKVADETCGDKICRDTFGYYPTQQDSLAKAIRAFAGEDRNHSEWADRENNDLPTLTHLVRMRILCQSSTCSTSSQRARLACAGRRTRTRILLRASRFSSLSDVAGPFRRLPTTSSFSAARSRTSGSASAHSWTLPSGAFPSSSSPPWVS